MNENKMNQINIQGTIYSENSMIENFIPQVPNNKILIQIDSNTNIQYYDNFSTYQECIREKKINLLESTNKGKAVDSRLGISLSLSFFC